MTGPEGGARDRPLQRGRSVSARLALVYGAFALLITLAVIGYAAWRGQVEMRRGEALLAAELQRVAERIANVLNADLRGLALLAGGSLPDEEPGRCGETLARAKQSLPVEVGMVLLLDGELRVRCSTEPADVGRQIPPGIPLIEHAVATRRGRIGNLARGAFSGRRVVGVVQPLLVEGRVAGLLSGPIEVDRLTRVAALLEGRPGTRLWLRDAEGQGALLTGDPQAAEEEAAPPPLAPGDWPEFGEARRLSAPHPTGTGQLVLAVRLADDLVLVGSFPSQATTARLAAEVALPAVTVGLLLLLGLGALIWSLQRLVLRPLQAATRSLERPGAAPAAEEEAAPAEIGDLIRRLGAARATQEESIRLRDLLLQEAHHRIKNHLALVSSFLRLQERHVTDPSAVAALRAAQGRMLAIAATYELLHEVGGAEVSLDRMLERFAHALPQRQDGGAVPGGSVETDLVALSVPADVAVKLGLVVNELATNALKYGRPGGKVRIGLRPRGEGFVLTVADDGPGLAPDAPRGLGMTVAEALVRSVGATLTRLPGPGTTWEMAWTPSAESVPAEPAPTPTPAPAPGR